MSQLPLPICYSGYSNQIISKARLRAALFVFLGSLCQCPRKLYSMNYCMQSNSTANGELAELAFMRKAATLGFAVAKPWGDSDRYDVIVRAGKVFWRVQVKSVLAMAPAKRHYRVKVTGNCKSTYTADEIDFLVAYIFPEDSWYVFPVAVIENRKVLCIRPGSKRSRLEQYREAWTLMRPIGIESTGAEAGAGAAARP